MNNVITRKVDMFTVVEDTCNNHPTDLDKVPAFKSDFEVFSGMVSEVLNLELKIDESVGGTTRAKLALKKLLCLQLHLLCGACKSLAYKTKDLEMREKFKYTSSVLKKIKEADLGLLAEKLSTAAQAMKAGLLLSYGIDEAFLSRLTELTVNYNKKKPQTRTKITGNKAIREELDLMMTATNDFLRYQLDESAKKFLEEAPLFYREYTNARRNYQTGTRRQGEAKTEVAEPENTATSNSEVTAPLLDKTAPAPLPSTNGVHA